MNKIKSITLPRAKGVCPFKASELKTKVKNTLSVFLNIPLVTFEGKHGYLFLKRSDNDLLFKCLDDCGFWLFHCSNTQQELCSVHQVSLYLKWGWRKFYLGHYCPKGEVEIHHLDHDPKNNHHTNLVYVTPQENQLLSSICRMQYHGQARSASVGVFNSKKLNTRMAWLFKITFQRTFQRLGFKTPDRPLLEWLMCVPSKLGKLLIQAWGHVPPQCKLFLDQYFVVSL